MMDIIPKINRETQKSRYALYGAYALLCLALVAFGMLKIIQFRSVATISAARVLLAQSETPEEKKLEHDILTVRDRLQDAAVIFSSASNPLLVFSFLESAVLSNITLTNIQVSIDRGRAVVAGEGPDFFAVDRQLKAFKDIPGVAEIELSSLGFSAKGAITFVVNVQI